MKTPRELLLARHQAAAPKLDAIRREVVTAEFKSVGQASRLSPSEMMKRSETGATPVLRLLWQELIWPSRRIWTGLAAVWVLIFIVNVAQRDPAEVLARKTPASATDAILAWRQQERMLAELMATTAPAEAEPRKTTLPRPRTESRDRILTV